MINNRLLNLNNIQQAAKFILVSLSIFVLSIASISAIVGNVSTKTSNVYAASTSGITNYVWIDNGGKKEVQINTVSESLDQNGHYTTVFSFKKGPNNTASGDINILVGFERDRCPEPNGQDGKKSVRYPGNSIVFGCYTPWEDDQITNITLNESNNYAQTVSVTTTQIGGLSCGSFQNDLYVLSLNGEENFNYGDTQRGMALNSISNDPANKRNPGYQFNYNGKTYANASLMNAWSWMGTGKDLASCIPVTSPSPSPTPTPKPSVTPTPKPSASPSPSTVQCPTGKISKVVDSVIVCVAQNQEQTQTQIQNNNQNQNVNQNVNATGGSSSSSSSSSSSVNVTVNNPTPSPSASTTTVVLASNTSTVYQSQPQVVTQVKGDVKELPKTGLPLAALALGGLLPAGFGIKRFAKKSAEETTANSIWTEKQLNS
jgi:hypothetical protein